jgi:carboxyl-terminal processing protease
MENRPRKGLTKILVNTAIIVLVFYVGYSSGKDSVPSLSQVNGLVNMETGMPESVNFEPFWKVWNLINERYVPTKLSASTTPITNQDKVYGAIHGLANSLGDPYTVFFNPEEAKLFESEISGQFEGVGMELGIRDNQLIVVAPLKDTPADRAGIKPGDKIIEIDGQSASGVSVDVAVKKIRGKKGTKVELLVRRDGGDKDLRLSIIRDVINIPVINTEVKSSDGKTSEDVDDKPIGLRPDGIYVIRLFSFTGTSPDLFRDSLRKFILSGSNRLVLDLRSNPGGYLEAAVDMASWFLPAGKVVVSEQYAKGVEGRVYRSKGYDIFNENLKMVVLINEGSASASEILAGALQEYGIAKIVGVKSFGKGSVQELVPVTDDTSFKVTIARWVTPNGRSISEMGLQPDFEVKITADDSKEGRDPQMDKAIELLNK